MINLECLIWKPITIIVYLIEKTNWKYHIVFVIGNVRTRNIMQPQASAKAEILHLIYMYK
jgi:hypothetical protein